MAEAGPLPTPDDLPLQLTAPMIQRLARKGIDRQLTDRERVDLCRCVVFHIEAILRERRVPKVPGKA